jgi:hypothetical protein
MSSEKTFFHTKKGGYSPAKCGSFTTFVPRNDNNITTDLQSNSEKSDR